MLPIPVKGWELIEAQYQVVFPPVTVNDALDLVKLVEPIVIVVHPEFERLPNTEKYTLLRVLI
jgi:hypothetical protein